MAKRSLYNRTAGRRRRRRQRQHMCTAFLVTWLIVASSYVVQFDYVAFDGHGFSWNMYGNSM